MLLFVILHFQQEHQFIKKYEVERVDVARWFGEMSEIMACYSS